MINLIRNTINSFRAVFGNAAANAFIQATGITGSVQKAAITQLCIDLQASGLWSKMKAVYPMVTDNYNLLSYTEDFSNGVYTKLNTSITTNSATAPNGTLTADKLIENTTNDQHIFFTSNTATTGQVYTFSAYLKAADMQYGVIQIVDSSASNKRFTVLADLVNGIIVTTRSLNSPTNTSSSITSVGNGWYRVTCTMSQVGGTTCYTNVGISNSSNPTWNAVDFPSYAGTNGNGIYVWGLQCEQSSTASAYQPIATTPSAFMASQMKYNLKDARDLDAAFRLTWSGGWTYSATGATPNGTNAYALTNLSQINAGMFNNYHMSYYSRTDFTSAIGQVEMGVGSSPGNYSNVLLRLDTTTNYLGGSSGSRSVLATASNSLGHLTVTGLSASAKAIKNGAIVATDTTTQTGAPLTASIAIGAQYNGSVAGAYSSRQCAFASVGNGLSDNDAMLLNQIVEKYQVALSRGVQAAQSFYYNSAYSNEANTYLYSTQITGTTQVSAINTLINGLKANNLWSKMKAVYPFVTDKTLQADMAAQMKFNLVNPQDSDAAFRLAFSGGWTYSTNGAQPNGVNGFAYTSLVPDNNGLTANNNSLSFYSRTSAANGATQFYEMGSGNTTGTDLISLYTRRSTDIAAYDTGSFALNRNSYTNTDGSGYYIGKINSDLTSKVFRNGVLKGTKTITNQATLSSFQIYLGGFNENNTTVYFSPKQVAFAHIGTGLSDAEVAILNQLVTDYETTLNRNV